MAVVVSFTSCGSNDDDFDNIEEDTPGVLGYKYVEPCLQWNATNDEVATYMNGIGGWSLKTTYNSTISTEIWMCSYPTTTITYTYDNGVITTGLSCVLVTYYSGKDSEFADLRGNIEKAYNCTLKKDGEFYTAEDVVINGRKANIEVMSYTEGGVSFMGVMYSLSY